MNFRNHDSSVTDAGESLSGSSHGNDGVAEADVREEEREPARKGAEAPLGATEAKRVDIEEEYPGLA